LAFATAILCQGVKKFKRGERRQHSGQLTHFLGGAHLSNDSRGRHKPSPVAGLDHCAELRINGGDPVYSPEE
jgi:hypothetical protein